jgi:hypothetical protein
VSDGPSRSGGSADWLKVKNLTTSDDTGSRRGVVTDAPLPLKYATWPTCVQKGVRSLDVQCFGCRHDVVVNADKYPGDLLLKEFMVCTKYGMVGDWRRIRKWRARPSARRSARQDSKTGWLYFLALQGTYGLVKFLPLQPVSAEP